MQRIFRALSVFDSGLSITQTVGTVIWLLLVGGSGTVTGWLAKNAPIIAQFGPLAWIGAGLVASLAVAAILAIMRWADSRLRYGEYLSVLSSQGHNINPLATSFEDRIIKLDDLHLPGMMLHERKVFKRCKFVGPGAVAVMAGSFLDNQFDGCGDVISVGGANITGIPCLSACVVEQCEFFRVTIVADPRTASIMKAHGFSVAGVDDKSQKSA